MATTEPQIIPPGTDVTLYVAETPANMFQITDLPELLFKKIEAEIAAFVPDLSTVTSRKEIAALSFKVARTKTAVDAAGMELTEDMRKAVANINAQRNVFKARFEALQTKARKPLTDWEDAEAKREAAAKAIMDTLRNAAVVTINETAAAVRERIMKIRAIVLDPAILGPEHSITGPHIQQQTLKALEEAYGRLVAVEKNAAELKRLQDAEAVRNAAAAQEASSKAAQDDAKAAEERRLQEVAAAEERGRKAAAEATEAAEASRRAEEEKRRTDEEHRNKVLAETAAAIVKISGISKKSAAALAEQIAAGSIPHVKMEF